MLALGVVAAVAGNVLVDRASWKLNAVNRPVYELFAHVPRFSDLALSQNGLAAVLVLCIPFGAGLAAASRRWRLPLAGLALLLALELIVTESRAGILSLGAAWVLFAALTRGRARWLWLLAPPLALLAVASGQLTPPVELSWLPTGGSSAERLGIWQSALLMIQDMPFTGIGLGMFQRVYPLYILPAFQNIHPHAHNLFLQTWLDAGVLGCAGMLLLAAAAVRAMVRLCRAASPDGISVAAAVSTAGMLLHAQVDSYFAGDPRTYFLMFVPLALLLAAEPPPRLAVNRAWLALALAPLLLLPRLVPAFWVNAGSVERLKAELVGPGHQAKATDAFHRALALDPRNPAAERGLGLLDSGSQASGELAAAVRDGARGALVRLELGNALAAAGQRRQAIAAWRAAGAAPLLVRQAAAEDDEQGLLLALAVDPQNAEAYDALARLYLRQRRDAEARQALRARAALPHPAYADLLLALLAERQDGGDALASAYVQLALQAAPDDEALSRAAGSPPPRNARASDTLGRAYEEIGEPALAEDEYRRVAGVDPIGHYDLGLLHLDNGRLDGAIAHLRQAADAIPNQEDFRLALARAYAIAGDLAHAAQEYRVVLDLDPGNPEARASVR